jgi:NAD(P)-dependent dehydrogenase (short-subunit alcohol dehydrogenase family)
MDWFDGKRAVVTGAARGIGRSTAELLDELGASVIAVDIDGAALDEAFAHSEVRPLVADVAGDGAALAARILDEHGTVELLVNNVGIDSAHSFLELGEEDFDRVFATNLRGPWFLTRGLVSRMLEERRRGSIVFVSSLHDTFVRTFPHYSASKAAVSMLVKELAAELGPHGVRVNAVSPGAIQSAHVPAPGESERRRLQALIPLGSIGQPGQVARVIALQLSDEWSSYTTGANVRVDGGLGLHSWSLDRDASGS